MTKFGPWEWWKHIQCKRTRKNWVPQVSHTNHLCKCMFMLCFSFSFSSSFSLAATVSPGLRIDQFTANWARFRQTPQYGFTSTQRAFYFLFLSNHLRELLLWSSVCRPTTINVAHDLSLDASAEKAGESFRRAGKQVQLVSCFGNCTTWNQLVCANAIAKANNSHPPPPTIQSAIYNPF